MSVCVWSLLGPAACHEGCGHSVPLCHSISSQQQQTDVPCRQLPRHKDYLRGCTGGWDTGTSSKLLHFPKGV